MNSFVVICLWVVVGLASAIPTDQYTDRYDSINVDEILANHRLLEPYINCLLGKGKCTAEGRELKSHVVEAMENNCAKCTPVQRTRSRQVIGHLINHEPAAWTELCQKFDPENKFSHIYEKELRELTNAYFKMNSFVVLCLFAVVAISAAEQYTDRYDNVDLDEILGNRRLLVPYIKCILDEGKCSPDGKELKAHIKEALENNCEKCTDTQKSGTRRVIGHLINNEKEYWTKLSEKYDPERKYVVKYENELAKISA
ncbi:uncharacterized protein [Battus philenor]|uniref:uncharacterized protein n=1 Tax=Battus philenor TaxID=42288 RepID=UPI0035CF7769